jgi:ketosteroid isomerase-like protein
MTNTIEAHATDIDTTRKVALAWFEHMSAGQVQEALQLCAEDIEFINYEPVPGYNTRMPWIGTKHGPAETLASFGQFVGVAEVGSEQLVKLIIEGDTAVGIVHEVSTIRETGRSFDIEFVQVLTVQDGKIRRWKSYTDPSRILQAMDLDAGAAE